MTGGENYCYHFTAYNVLGGESEYSTKLSVVPITIPSGLSAPTFVTKSKNSITVTWNTPTSDGDSEILKYILYIKAEYESSYTEIYSGLSTSYKATLLRTGFNYQFKIRAVNLAGISDFSSASANIITALAPGIPRNLDLVSRSST